MTPTIRERLEAECRGRRPVETFLPRMAERIRRYVAGRMADQSLLLDVEFHRMLWLSCRAASSRMVGSQLAGVEPEEVASDAAYRLTKDLLRDGLRGDLVDVKKQLRAYIFRRVRFTVWEYSRRQARRGEIQNIGKRQIFAALRLDNVGQFAAQPRESPDQRLDRAHALRRLMAACRARLWRYPLTRHAYRQWLAPVLWAAMSDTTVDAGGDERREMFLALLTEWLTERLAAPR